MRLPRRPNELALIARRSREVVLMAAVTGAATGLVVALFERIVVPILFENLLRLPLWAIAVAPVVGMLLTAMALRLGGGVGPGTADEYLHAFHDPTYQLGLRALAARLAAAVFTLGFGGPMGLEGPSLYSGAAIGSTLQRRLPKIFRGSDHRTLLVAGAAAGVAAIFKAPATGAVFAMEVPFRDDLARRMLLPSLVAAASGYLSFAAVNGTTPLFPIGGDPGFSFRDLLGAVLLGVLAGVGARLFSAGIRWAKGFAKRPLLLRLFVVGPAMVALFVATRFLTGENLAVGSGYNVISWLGTGNHSLWVLTGVLCFRCLGTTATVAGGGVGGLFIPLAVAGSVLGRMVGDAFRSLDSGLFTVIGVAAFLGAGYRVPLAAVMFVAETTGHPGFIVPGLLAAVAAELVVGTASVTTYQRATTRQVL